MYETKLEGMLAFFLAGYLSTIASRERSHIPPGEKEHHRLKSDDW